MRPGSGRYIRWLSPLALGLYDAPAVIGRVMYDNGLTRDSLTPLSLKMPKVFRIGWVSICCERNRRVYGIERLSLKLLFYLGVLSDLKMFL